MMVALQPTIRRRRVANELELFYKLFHTSDNYNLILVDYSTVTR